MIPDYIEPLTGYRLWLVGGPILRSCIYHHVLWPPYAVLMRDVYGFRGSESEEFGAKGSAGIYAFRSLDTLADSDIYRLPARLASRSWSGYCIVGGTVSLWGEIHEHEHGYRAEYAYPKELVALPAGPFDNLVASPECVADVAAMYGIPVASEETHEDWHIHTHRGRRAFDQSGSGRFTVPMVVSFGFFGAKG